MSFNYLTWFIKAKKTRGKTTQTQASRTRKDARGSTRRVPKFANQHDGTDMSMSVGNHSLIHRGVLKGGSGTTFFQQH